MVPLVTTYSNTANTTYFMWVPLRYIILLSFSQVLKNNTEIYTPQSQMLIFILITPLQLKAAYY